MKLKIGITGQEGFIGKHLYHFLGLYPEEFDRIDFERSFFESDSELQNFVSKCDVIVHLAAMNRHDDGNVIYETNLALVNKLINALKVTESKPHIFFSSSSQEERDNLYGKSKKEGRMLFAKWATEVGGQFTGMVIPNVFGPFGSPNYNSFIATFCHQLTHNESPRIDADGEVKLIYVGNLVNIIKSEIISRIGNDLLVIPHSDVRKVSDILSLLQNYKENYLTNGVIPELKNDFELNLFNTFRSYIDVGTHFPIRVTKHVDPRGAFVEIIRLGVGGQVSFSTTVPGITRGNHFHTRKIERFAVIKGKALIQLRKIGTNKVFDFYLDGNEPAYVDMPIWYTHNIKNIGDEELYTNFWINEFFDPNDPDTYLETV